jgi:NADH-quinone oxidoreductase subunit G
MPHIFIDGQKIEARDGQTIIEAAYENGLEIPHFCWHPELSVSGNCRMCLVEVGLPKRLPDGNYEKDQTGNDVVNYFPKLQIACATKVSDGMRVRRQQTKVVEAQEAVMEFLLINHPQEYAFDHSKGTSRFEETKNHKDKRQKWGPNVMFDAERCISCSRCIRFSKEVGKQDVLTFVQRGDHVTIELFEDTQLDNPYSMNVIDICPVGALTSPDFRFKARVWDMSFNDSICGTDGSGTNIKIGVRNNEILRLEPRTNMFVNKYWMSDAARLDYKWINENRVVEPMVSSKIVEWRDAFKAVSKAMKDHKNDEVMILTSGRTTNEDTYILKKFAQKYSIKHLYALNHIEQEMQDDMLNTKERVPNTSGLKTFGIEASDKVTELLKSGKIKCLFLIEEDLQHNTHLFDSLDKVDTLVVAAYNHSKLTEKANILLPAATYAEIEGTFTNVKNRVQHFEPALVTKENIGRMGMKMSRLDKMGAHNDRWTKHEQRNCKQTWRVLQAIANLDNANWQYKTSEDVFEEIANSVAPFKNMSYEKLDLHQGLVLGNADRPDKVVHNYHSHVMKPN